MLVFDTDKTKAFIEALETMPPSLEYKVLQFTVELLKNARAFESRINTMTEQMKIMLEQLDSLDKEDEKETDTEESAYEDTDEEETDVD